MVVRVLLAVPSTVSFKSRRSFWEFFDGRAMYPTFKKRQGKQSIHYPQNVKVFGPSEIKFPGNLGTVRAKVHRDINGKVKTVTVKGEP